MSIRYLDMLLREPVQLVGYVRIRQDTSGYVSTRYLDMLLREPVELVESLMRRGLEEDCSLLLRCQYWYFCTSKPYVWKASCGEVWRRIVACSLGVSTGRYVCTSKQYVCTSNASEHLEEAV
jgi:hypothetical protein